MANATPNKIFKLVRHPDVLDHLLLGWHIAQVDIGHHSHYSVLMQWLCACEVREPYQKN